MVLFRFNAFSRIISLVSALLLLGCSKENNVDIKKDLSAYENGDVVFRLGDSSVSNVVMVADELSNYSHVGIIFIDSGKPMVIHACPPDVDEMDPDNMVKKESIADFFSEKNALNGALYRYADKTIAEKAAKQAFCYYQDSIPFDYNFDTNDSSALYCTELVENAYSIQGVSLSNNQRRHVAIPGIDIDSCILISDFLESEKIYLISSF